MQSPHSLSNYPSQSVSRVKSSKVAAVTVRVLQVNAQSNFPDPAYNLTYNSRYLRLWILAYHLRSLAEMGAVPHFLPCTRLYCFSRDERRRVLQLL